MMRAWLYALASGRFLPSRSRHWRQPQDYDYVCGGPVNAEDWGYRPSADTTEAPHPAVGAAPERRDDKPAADW